MLKRKVFLILVSSLVLILGTGCGNKDSGTSPSNNQPPVIHEVKAESSQLEVGTRTTITCVANDIDSDNLTYTWSLNDKTLPDTGASISWTAPMEKGTYRIVVVVSDGNKEDRKEIEITVTDNRPVYYLAEYFPLGQGDSWTYKESESEEDEPVAETTSTYIISGEMEIHGVTAIKMVEVDDTSSYELYTNIKRVIKLVGFGGGNDEGGLYGIVSEGMIWTQPIGFSSPEIRIGDQIEIRTFARSMDGKATVGPFYITLTIKGPEDVSTPCGVFNNCLLLDIQTLGPGGITLKDTWWLAKGVGLVKEREEVIVEKTVWEWTERLLLDYKVGGLE